MLRAPHRAGYWISGRTTRIESVLVTLATPEDPVHDIGSALQDGPDLLAVDQLGHDRALVADQPEISSNGIPLSDGSDTKPCR
jgi:hypothetical protein